MDRSSTVFLKAVVLLIGVGVLALCVFVLPAGIRNTSEALFKVLFIGMYIPAVPFFIGIFQIFKLLNIIDANNAFSEATVSILKTIKYITLAIFALYAVALPLIFIVAQKDDAPGVVLLGLIFTFAPLIIALFSAIFEKLLQNAIDIKLENEQIV